MPSHWGGAREMSTHRKKRDEEELAAILALLSDKSPPEGDDSIQDAPLQLDDLLPSGAAAKGAAGSLGLAMAALKDDRLVSWLKNRGIKDHILDMSPKELLSKLFGTMSPEEKTLGFTPFRRTLHEMNGARTVDQLGWTPKDTAGRAAATHEIAQLQKVPVPVEYEEVVNPYAGYWAAHGTIPFQDKSRVVNNLGSGWRPTERDSHDLFNAGVINHEVGHAEDTWRLRKQGRVYQAQPEGLITDEKMDALEGVLATIYPGVGKEVLRDKARQLMWDHELKNNPWLAMRAFSQGHHDSTPGGWDANYAQKSLATEALDEGRLVHPDILAEHPELARKAGVPPAPQALHRLRPEWVKATPKGKLPRAAFRDEHGEVWRQRDTGWIDRLLKEPGTPPEQVQHLRKIRNKLQEIRDFSETDPFDLSK